MLVRCSPAKHRHTEPPPPPSTPLRTPPHLAFHSSGLRVPPSCPTAKPRPKPTPRAPLWPSPVTRRRGTRSSGEPRRPHAPDPPWPPDIGWTAEIRTALLLILAIRSGSDGPDLSVPLRLDFLLKSPWIFPDSTRGPELFKNNCRLTHVFTRTPLTFLVLAPAVQLRLFCALAPGSNL